MACLRKRKIKKGFVYVVDYSFEGRRYAQSTKTSDLGVAKIILHDIQGKIARGTFNLEQYEKKQIRLSAFFKEYFEYAPSIKQPRTIDNDRNYVKKFITFVGDVNLRSIDVRVLDHWKADSLSKVSPTTFNMECRMLQAAFQVAVKWKLLDTNPFREISKAKPDEKRLFMKAEEVEKIFDLIESDQRTIRVKKHQAFLRRFHLLLTFLLNTGLRRNEALTLKSENVDRSRNLIYIEHTKNNRTRTIPLNKVALFILDELGDAPFHGMNLHHVSRKFGHYVRKAKLNGFKLHSLRHTFATNLVSAGVDIYTVSRLLGHSDIRTSLIYAKARVETLRDAVRLLEKSEKECYDLVTAELKR